MDFFLHQDFSEFSESDWNALVEQSITDTPFSRHEYLSEWWKTLGGGEWKQAELVLVSARENDQIVGFVPLFLAEYDGQQAVLQGAIGGVSNALPGSIQLAVGAIQLGMAVHSGHGNLGEVIGGTVSGIAFNKAAGFALGRYGGMGLKVEAAKVDAQPALAPADISGGIGSRLQSWEPYPAIALRHRKLEHLPVPVAYRRELFDTMEKVGVPEATAALGMIKTGELGLVVWNSPKDARAGWAYPTKNEVEVNAPRAKSRNSLVAS